MVITILLFVDNDKATSKLIKKSSLLSIFKNTPPSRYNKTLLIIIGYDSFDFCVYWFNEWKNIYFL